jgi:citrate synthase
MTDQAKLTFNGLDVELPVRKGTLGPDVIEVSKLGKSGYFTLDPGFRSTASCESKITFIDGQKGVLLYRGYPIDQLANKCKYLEVCYLLMHGELPNESEKAEFDQDIKNHIHVHEQMSKFFSGFRRDAHPMAIMVGVVGALSAFYHDRLDIHNPTHRRHSVILSVYKIHLIL